MVKFRFHILINVDELIKVEIETAKKKVKFPPHKYGIKRRREFRGMRRAYARRSEHEMKCNIKIGVFALPSKGILDYFLMLAIKSNLIN